MPIWNYEEWRAPVDEATAWRTADHSERFQLTSDCSYCEAPMLSLAGTALPEFAYRGTNANQAALLGCPVCGWWKVLSFVAASLYETYDGGFCELRSLSGVLRNLDLADVSVPTEELRSYLVARYDDRFLVHPKKYEDIVGGVFSDFGFRVRVTSFSGDEGIDVFVLDGNDNTIVGIQVKRHAGKVSAEQIRSFVGALFLKGLTAGIFVTTGAYQRGAFRTAFTARGRGLSVKLMDARRFYDALRLTTRTAHLPPEDPSAPYHQCWNDVSEYLTRSRTWPQSRWFEEAELLWVNSW